MSTLELPDVETLLVKHLATDAGLKAAGLKQISGPASPKQPKWPSVHIHRSGGPAPIPYWLDGGRVQIDVWGTEDTAKLRSISSKVFASLQGLVGVHEGGVVVGVEETLGRTYLPDPVTSRPRVIFEVRVFAHPLPTAVEESFTVFEDGNRIVRLREPIEISEDGNIVTIVGE